MARGMTYRRAIEGEICRKRKKGLLERHFDENYWGRCSIAVTYSRELASRSVISSETPTWFLQWFLGAVSQSADPRQHHP